MNWFQTKEYIKYVFKKKHWRKEDFNSDLAEEIAKYILYETSPFYHFKDIDEIRKDLLQSCKKIEVNDLGAGSRKFKTNKRSIQQLAKHNASSNRQGEIISRLVAYFKPKNIIELGTSLGIGTLYLALPNSSSQVFTIEGCPKVSSEAKQNFSIAQAHNIIQHTGSFEKKLPQVLNQLDKVDLVYFDGHHDYQATLNYFEKCLIKTSGLAVFIFDDIYWSEGMAKAWYEIKTHVKVSVSFDLYRFGIVVLNIPHVKESYVIKGS